MKKITIIDDGKWEIEICYKKWKIEKQKDGLYKFTYHEYFTRGGWRETGKETNYTKEAIEHLFDIKLDDNSKISKKIRKL